MLTRFGGQVRYASDIAPRDLGAPSERAVGARRYLVLQLPDRELEAHYLVRAESEGAESALTTEHRDLLLSLVSNLRPKTTLTLGAEIELIFDVTLDREFYDPARLRELTSWMLNAAKN